MMNEKKKAEFITQEPPGETGGTIGPGFPPLPGFGSGGTEGLGPGTGVPPPGSGPGATGQGELAGHDSAVPLEHSGSVVPVHTGDAAVVISCSGVKLPFAGGVRQYVAEGQFSKQQDSLRCKSRGKKGN